MKKFIYILSCICLSLLVFPQMQAQTCSSDFTINTSIKNSTCLSNGEITVTLSGDIDNIFNVQYGLSSTNGFTINPQSDSILRNIPPGTYQLTVRAFCKLNSDYDVVRNVSNLVVGGNYKVPQVSFNSSASRKSYENCNTGIIALNVTDGSGSFTFTITSAPAGITTPSVVVPVKKDNVYTLPGQNYPAGNYTVQVNDGCYTAVREFTLGTISGFPDFSEKNVYGFRPDVDNTKGSCGYVKWNASSSQISENTDYQRYYNDRMYEIGIAPSGQMPTNWTEWNTMGYIWLNLSPYNVSDFYSKKLTIYARLKGCETTYTDFSTYIKRPIITGYSVNNCDNYIRYIYPWTDYDGLVCYPLTLTVKKTNTGDVIYSKSNWMYNANRYDGITLEYNTNYVVTMVDQNGTTLTNNIQQNKWRYLSIGGNTLTCDSYTFYYYIYLSGSPVNCWDWPVKVTISDPLGTIVQQVNLTTSNSQVTPALEYDKVYTIKAEFPDGTVNTYTRSATSDLPTSYSISLYNSNEDKCNVNKGSFYVSGNRNWPSGTTMKITGPSGYITQTYTTSLSGSSYLFPYAYLPPGPYTLTVNHGCGTPVVTTFTHPGIYDYKDFGYDSLQTCSGIKISPKGTITYKGTPTSTYFRLISGPPGYETSVITPGSSFVFSAPGTYVLGILTNNSTSACAIGTIKIVYTAPPLDLDLYATAAYLCVGDTIGNISVKAINGVAPYTYELWNKTNTVKENIGAITTDGIAHFVYGKGNETYTVRISDQCGSNFQQQITLAKLSEARVVYSPENNVCYDGTIQLRCITLGQTTYNWTGPNNFSSTEQNPLINNATELMTGWYTVSVTPEFCGSAVEDRIYIKVYPRLVAGPVLADQEVCVRTLPPVLESQTTGGDGVYTYQWQNSLNGVSGWANISGATNATYQPDVELKSGVKYYRKMSTNTCGTIYSDPIALTTKACYIPVNTNVRSKVKK